jgi:hypothetical protein
MENWYSITSETIRKYGGNHIISKYGTVSKLLESIYTEHKWQTWRLGKVPHGYWQNMQNRVDLVEWLGKELKIQELDDWYRISDNQIQQLAPLTSIRAFGGVYSLLPQLYPKYPWNYSKLFDRKGPIKSSQRILFLIIQEIFPSSGYIFFF